MLQRATPGRVDVISQREMRNSSGEVLRRVAAGESFLVSDGGRVTAMLVPAPTTPRDRLIASGQLRPAVEPLDVGAWEALDLPEAPASEAILDELRGDR